MMRLDVCECARAISSGRYYMGSPACRLCTYTITDRATLARLREEREVATLTAHGRVRRRNWADRQ